MGARTADPVLVPGADSTRSQQPSVHDPAAGAAGTSARGALRSVSDAEAGAVMKAERRPARTPLAMTTTSASSWMATTAARPRAPVAARGTSVTRMVPDNT